MYGAENKLKIVLSLWRGKNGGIQSIIKKKMREQKEQRPKLELLTTNFYYASLKCKKDINLKF